MHTIDQEHQSYLRSHILLSWFGCSSKITNMLPFWDHSFSLVASEFQLHSTCYLVVDNCFVPETSNTHRYLLYHKNVIGHRTLIDCCFLMVQLFATWLHYRANVQQTMCDSREWKLFFFFFFVLILSVSLSKLEAPQAVIDDTSIATTTSITTNQ